MAKKMVDSVLIKNTNDRNSVLRENKGRYNAYKYPLNVIVGDNYRLYENEKNPANKQQHEDILRYTHNEKNEYSENIHKQYGINKENLKYYSHRDIHPSFKVNNYDGYEDYISYMWDVYGMDESYAGHLMGLLGVRELAEDLAYDVVPSFEGKTAQDVINEILRYSDMEYALEQERVGIIRDIDVSKAIQGVITTNINNYSGKESKMGMITNRMYAMTLLHGAQFNSMRRTKYITPELDTLYGNNLNNVYNLSSLFRINDETGRIADPDSNQYIQELTTGNVFDYLKEINPDFTLPENGYDWSTHPNYGPNENTYYGISENTEGTYITPEHNDWTIKNSDKQINTFKSEDSFRVYSEGPEIGQGGWAFNELDTIDGDASAPISDIEVDNLLNKTNKFLSDRKVQTIISRFHNKEDIDNGLTQSAVYRNFGVSHGRNLLTKVSYETGKPSAYNNGYSNPYCRVWTNHYQYSKMKHLIRHFINDNTFVNLDDLQKEWFMFRASNASQRLSDNSVLNKNGMVNITPTSGEMGVDVRNCMFSIENLAWRDVLTEKEGRYRHSRHVSKGEDGTEKVTYKWEEDNEPTLSKEQRGPNGGRIMWFPPYDLNFQETAQAKWSPNEFIGRGEPVYTYVNSSRSGTLDFTILVDHPSVVDYWMLDKKNNSTEADEQTLLRFFAGCETINPTEDVLEHINENGEYITPSKDPQESLPQKDIIFYTFFPNNYSGNSVTGDTLNAVSWLFGGQGNARDKVYPNEGTEENSPKIIVTSDKIQTVTEYGGTVTFKYELENTTEGEVTYEITYDTEHIIEAIDTLDNGIKLTIKKNEISSAKYCIITLKHEECNDVILKVGLSGVNSVNDFPDDFFEGGDEINGSVLGDESFYLGYEMGVNPMSINYFTISEEETEDNVYFLDYIYDYNTAKESFGDLLFKSPEKGGFVQNINITLDDILTCDIKNYNEFFNQYNENDKDIRLNEQRTEELKELGRKLDDDITNLKTEIADLENRLLDIESGTTAHYAIQHQIEQLKQEQAVLEMMVGVESENEDENKTGALEVMYNNIEENTAELETKGKELLEKIHEIEDKFSVTAEYCKTNPLFIYYEYKGESTFENGDGVEICKNAIDAYAKYKVDHLRTYYTNYLEERPYEALSQKDVVLCVTKCIKEENKISYWVKELNESSGVPYIEVENKRKFSKSDFIFGKKENEEVYFIKHGGETIEFKNTKNETAKNRANKFIVLNDIVPTMNKEEFLSSNSLCSFDDKAFCYYYYDFTQISEDIAEEKLKETLREEASNCKSEEMSEDEYIINKYYEDHRFGCISDMGFLKNYGVIQFFATGKLQENGGVYKTVQDLIARHDFIGDAIIPESGVFTTEGEAKSLHVSEEKTDKAAKVVGEVYWDMDNPEWGYPIDSGKENEKLLKKNYYDMKSFGLNSTYEVVKKEMGDNDVTFSFGEVYAALHGDKEINFVLSCERGILQKVLKYEGEQLEEKVNEARDRIMYLKQVFKPNENGVTDLKVTKVETLGTASVHGYEGKNKILSDNREKTLQNFIKSFEIMKSIDVSSANFDPDGNETNENKDVDENNSKDINDISAKKGRSARVSIIVGEKDMTSAEREKIEENKDLVQTEKRIKLQRRYDNERLFFSMLKENDNIAYKRLIDKVKYFSPAFHSITPEGFNARLTFLHQCTRQGPTATSSDIESGTTASNLAFGRAPFCILRLGDFLNTKIVIDSVNITYPDSMWDLNPEGIGAQFMMAKISMQIHILGGSDITAPIKRLQNAVSFNYYANTSIYDNRSDHAIKSNKVNENGNEDRTWFAIMNNDKNGE